MTNDTPSAPSDEASSKGKLVFGGVVILVILVIIGGIAWSSIDASKIASTGQPPNTNEQGAVVVGNGPVSVDIYEDFQCPGCSTLEKTQGAAIQKLIDTGKITVNYHTMSFLGPESDRAAAAAFCAAAISPSQFSKLHSYLFANQPPEKTGGFTTNDLLAAGTALGLDPSYATCVQNATYAAYAKVVTENASKAGVVQTPTVFVNGTVVPGTGGPSVQATPQQVLDAINAAVGSPSPKAGL